jgi:hypothetical protein
VGSPSKFHDEPGNLLDPSRVTFVLEARLKDPATVNVLGQNVIQRVWARSRSTLRMYCRSGTASQVPAVRLVTAKVLDFASDRGSRP